MTIREYNKVFKGYKDQIERDLAIGALHVNTDGYIKKSVLIGRDIMTGKSRRIQVEGRSADECARKLADKYQALVDDVDITQEFRTFGDVAEEWYNVEIKDSGISAGNKRNYRCDLDRNILPYLRNLDITQLKKKDFQLFLNRFAGRGESMVKKIRMTVMRIIKYAMENEYMQERWIHLKLPATKAIAQREILTEEQMKLLMRSVENYAPAFVYVVMLATGLRPCEVYHVRYEDVDLEKRILSVRHSKTKNGLRILPLPLFCVDLIEQDKKRMQEAGKASEYVFHQVIQSELPHNATTLTGNWKTTLRTMDILNGAKVYRNRIAQSSIPNKDKLTPYSLRHTYCTMLNDCGIGEYFKKRLMGHTLKDSITDGVYTHSTDDRLIMAARPFVEHIQKIYDKTMKKNDKNIDPEIQNSGSIF